MARAEWRWLAVITLATLLLAEGPYLLAYMQHARGWVFTGMLWTPHDFAQYGAAMREGALSPSWLVHDHLTGEPHQPAFIYPLYVGLGKLAGLVGLGVQPIYHGAEIGARAILFLSIYLLCTGFFPGANQRRVAFVLVVFSSGLAFWLQLLDPAMLPAIARPEFLATDAEYAEINTFLVLFTTPHLILGLALLLLAVRFYLASWSHSGPRYPALAAAAVLGLGLANPFSLVTLCMVLSGHLAVLWLRSRRLPRGALLGAAAIFLAAAPFLAYSLLVFGADPFWSATYGRQNLTLSPPLPFVALGLAPVLVLAALASPALLRRPTPERWLLLVWIALTLALMYAPVGIQRRFGLGLQPMLGIAAAFALESTWRWARRPKSSLTLPRPLLLSGLAAALFTSTAYSYALTLGAAYRPTDGQGRSVAFQPVSLAEAGAWLASIMAPTDVVLGETLTGNYLAGVVPGRVFVGHGVATLHAREKQEEMRRFYREEGDGERQHFLAANKIRYVVYGPQERALGPVPPVDSRYLTPVYATSEVSIYEVRPDGDRATEESTRPFTSLGPFKPQESGTRG